MGSQRGEQDLATFASNQPKKGGKDLRNVANNGLIVLSDWLDVRGEKRENSDQRLPNTSV